MSTDDDAGLTDETIVELNATGPGPDHGPQSPSIPPRPADSADKVAWSAYVVALGLHPDEADKHTKAELIDLATRFGG